MIINVPDLENTIQALLNLPAETKLQCKETIYMLRKMEKQVKERQGFQMDIIDRNSYIATVLWKKEDIRDTLSTMGFSVTEEMVDIVTARVKARLEDTSRGWEAIEEVIEECEKEGLFQSTTIPSPSI